MRLFNVGLPKSGTTTLHKAVYKANLKSAHWRVMVSGGENGKHRRFVGTTMYENFRAGRDPFFGFEEYDAVTQADVITARFSLWPQMDLKILDSIRARQSDCTFLLLTRDPQKIVSSIDRWKNLRTHLNNLGAPGLAPGQAESDAGLVEWIDHHNGRMRDYFKGEPNFLEISIEDPQIRNKISDILGVNLPWWGTANSNPAK